MPTNEMGSLKNTVLQEELQKLRFGDELAKEIDAVLQDHWPWKLDPWHGAIQCICGWESGISMENWRSRWAMHLVEAMQDPDYPL